MKKIRGKFNEGLLPDGMSEEKIGVAYKRKSPVRKGRIMYKIYLVTTLATVLAVLLVFAFGMNNNRPLIEELSLRAFADRVGDFFVSIGFGQGGNLKDNLTESSDTSDGSSNTDNLETNRNDNNNPPSTDVGATIKGLYDFDYSLVPDGHTPIIPMDLSLKSYGSLYINNETGYTPNIGALIGKNLKKGNGYEYLSVSSGPLVLIIHTHGTEGYSDDGAISCPDGNEYSRSNDTSKNVVAVGATIAEILNRSGVPTAHCTIMHDSIQYKDSYTRAEETIKKYLEEYPTIRLVIDVHRDAIVKSNGDIVRPVTEYNGEAAAQVMCVVGSDWGGDNYSNWENNLALALKLREGLNEKCENICRPVNLRSSTYNQEFAEYSLLIEVGAGGNSLSEAIRSAELVAEQLVKLMSKI